MMCGSIEDFFLTYDEDHMKIFKYIYKSSKIIHDIICDYVAPMNGEDEDHAEEFRIGLCCKLRNVFTGKNMRQSIRDITDNEDYKNILKDIKEPLSEIIKLHRICNQQIFFVVFYDLISHPCSGFPSYDYIPPSANRIK